MMSSKSNFFTNYARLFALVMVVISITSFASNAQVISSIEDINAQRKASIYNKTDDFNIGNFLNGRVYPMKYIGVANSQFVFGDYLLKGDIVYDGVEFKNRLIQYDTYKQLIVMEVNHGESRFILSLDRDKVSEMIIDGRRFISYEDSVLEKNIYEIPYDGIQAKALIYRTRTQSRVGSSARVYYELDPVNRYYVVNQYGTFRINGKKDMIKAFGEEKKMKDIIKRNKLKFGKNTIYGGMVKALSLYED